jgi:hypothetical protein
MSLRLSPALLEWLNANGPLACVGFVAVCALLSFRPKRDR